MHSGNGFKHGDSLGTPAPEAPVSIHFDPSYRLPPDRGEGRPATSPRYFIIACCFFATFAAYVERISFSIAYTSMARDAGTDEAVKGVVMASFFWGYAISQVPGGWAAQRYGGRIVLLLCFASWSTLSLLTPGSGSNTSGLTLARFLIGVSQGFLIPSVHTVLAMWVPPRDRVKATSMTTSGMYLGSACATLVLPSIELHLGAASLLRVVGVLGLCWMVCWYQAPAAPRSSQHDIPLRNDAADDNHRTGRSAPWKRIALHPAVWAIVSNNFTFHYAFYIVMNWMPTYFHSLLHKDLSSLGMLKAFPYIGMFVMSNAGGWMGDWLIHKYQFTIAGARKTVNTLGFVGSALALLAMPLARGALPGIVCTALCLAMLGLSRGGFSVNHMDIAPMYAGAVMGISNTAGTVAGVIGVSTTGWLLSRAGGPDSPSGWWNVFSHSALVCVAGMGIFTSFARGEQLFD